MGRPVFSNSCGEDGAPQHLKVHLGPVEKVRGSFIAPVDTGNACMKQLRGGRRLGKRAAVEAPNQLESPSSQ